MAFKYKLVNEVSPMDIEKAAGTVGPDVMKGIADKQLNHQDFEDLKQILGQAGIEQDKINTILDMWGERTMFVNPNEGKDPLQKGLDDILKQLKSEEEPDTSDPKTKVNRFRDEIREAVTTRLKENKPCWSGYKKQGMKKKNGKLVSNCVPNK
jgi:hypothetical protein